MCFLALKGQNAVIAVMSYSGYDIEVGFETGNYCDAKFYIYLVLHKYRGNFY